MIISLKSMNLYYFYTHYQLWQFQYWENWFLFWKWVRQKLLNHEYLPLWWWFQADFRLNLQKYAALCPWFSCFHQFLSLILTVLNVRLTFNDRYGRVFSLSSLNSFIFKQFSFDFAKYFFVSESTEMVINGLPRPIIFRQ